MERKLQDHQQTLESMSQQAAAEEEQLRHEAKLKKEAKEVCVHACMRVVCASRVR